MTLAAARALWDATARAVHANFPDRAREMLRALERRLEPGPWSLTLVRRPGEDDAIRWPHDSLCAELGRALRAADAELGDERLRALEAWLRASAIDEGLVHFRYRNYRDKFPDWAAYTLEAGLDTPALRVLAGLTSASEDEQRAEMGRALRELGANPADELDGTRRTLRRLAREIIQGVMQPRAQAATIRWLLSTTHDAQRIREAKAWGGGLETDEAILERAKAVLALSFEPSS